MTSPSKVLITSSVFFVTLTLISAICLSASSWMAATSELPADDVLKGRGNQKEEGWLRKKAVS